MVSFLLVMSWSFIMMGLLWSVSPLSLGGIFLFSVFFTLLCASCFLSNWFLYIIFLSYVGGLLILFLYMCALSLAKSLDWDFSLGLLILECVFIMSVLVMMGVHNSEACLHDLGGGQFVDGMLSYSFNMSVISMYGYCWVVIMVSMLFFVMVLVVSVCRVYLGPLRILFS